MNHRIQGGFLLFCLLISIVSTVSSGVIPDHTHGVMGGRISVPDVIPPGSLSPVMYGKTTTISPPDLRSHEIYPDMMVHMPVFGGEEPEQVNAQSVQTLAAPTYEFLRRWGGEGNTTGKFQNPYAVALDGSGNVYVADTWNSRIQKFSSNGSYIWAVGYNGSGQGAFDHPRGIAIDTPGNIFVSDTVNNRIQKFSKEGNFIWAIGYNGSGAGYNGSDPGSFASPRGITVDTAGNLFVADCNNHRVQKFTNNGSWQRAWGSQGSADGQFENPTGVAVDSHANVFVADQKNHRVQKFTNNGTWISTWGGFGQTEGRFNLTFDVAVDSEDNVFVSDYGRDTNRIQKFTNNGSFLTKFGSLGIMTGQFIAPGGVAVNKAGDVYVTGIGTGDCQIHVFVLSTTLPPAITSITPKAGFNTGVITAAITGKHFRTDATVTLRRGAMSIKGAVKNVQSNSIICTLPLRGVQPGVYNLVISNTDGTSAVKPGAFTISAPKPVITTVQPRICPKEANVKAVIIGNNFRKGLVVQMIKGKLIRTARIVSWKPGMITCILPTKGAPAGVWSIKVINSDKTFAVKNQAVTVKSNRATSDGSKAPEQENPGVSLKPVSSPSTPVQPTGRTVQPGGIVPVPIQSGTLAVIR